MGNMEFYRIIIYLLLFLTNYSLGENTETLAIKSKQKQDFILNELIPQHLYAIPNVPNIRPVLNLRLGNELNNIPKIIVPVTTEQKITLPSSSQTSTAIQPKKPDSNAKPIQIAPKEEKSKENTQEIKNNKAKTNSCEGIVKDDLKIDLLLKNETKKVVKQNVGTQKKDPAKNTSNPPISNQKPSEQEKPKPKPPQTNKNDKLEPPKENIEIPSNKIESVEKENKRENDFELENNNEDSPTIAIYKIDDEYSKAPNSGPNSYKYENHYLSNQPISNFVIKNQNIQEVCERAQDNSFITDVPTEQYFLPSNYYEPYTNPDSSTTAFLRSTAGHRPLLWHATGLDLRPSSSNHCQLPCEYRHFLWPNPDLQNQNNYLALNYDMLPKYHRQNIGNLSPMENNKDKIWRNWRCTEICISQYDPSKSRFNHVYADGNNGFITPFINGGFYDYGNQNVPFPYQCYSYPMYKYHRLETDTE